MGIGYQWKRYAQLDTLVLQVEGGLYRRAGKATTNFARTLPPRQSDLAQEIFKDPYNFDFLTLSSEAQERDIEQGLLGHLEAFSSNWGLVSLSSEASTPSRSTEKTTNSICFSIIFVFAVS